MNEQLKTFIENNINNDFDLTVQQVAEQCKSYGRFSAWLNQDVSRIIEVLNIVKSRGVSPAFFASYEVTEGYNSSWGWLNHTTVNGTPTQDAYVQDLNTVANSNAYTKHYFVPDKASASVVMEWYGALFAFHRWNGSNVLNGG